MTIAFLCFLTILGLLILAGYWYERSPWRQCPRCGFYWNAETGHEYNYQPSGCDGIVKRRECRTCLEKP